MHFRDRKEAGRQLAAELSEYKDANAVVYALSGGGAVLGAEIAKKLGAPLDLIMPRRVKHPDQPEYDVCAVTEDGHLVCSKQELTSLDPAWLTSEVQKEQAEAKRRHQEFAGENPALPAKNSTAIVVDEGIDTGLTILAAIEEIKDKGPGKVVLAAPVIPGDVAGLLKRYVDELVALDMPIVYLGAVGAYYDKFDQVGGKEVTKLVQKTRA